MTSCRWSILDSLMVLSILSSTSLSAQSISLWAIESRSRRLCLSGPVRRSRPARSARDSWSRCGPSSDLLNLAGSEPDHGADAIAIGLRPDQFDTQAVVGCSFVAKQVSAATVSCHQHVESAVIVYVERKPRRGRRVAQQMLRRENRSSGSITAATAVSFFFLTRLG